jgi:ParB family chromosome partitioning protein
VRGDQRVVDVERVRRGVADPRQPRHRIDPEQLAELADSIREHGIIQPLVVTRKPAPDGGAPRYQLIAGERRWEAAKRAGLLRVPVVVREAAGGALLELALVENVQREDLNPLEEATAYHELAEEFGLTQEQIGQRVGKSRFAIANTMRLLQLPAAVQQALLDGQLSEGHARAILGLRDREAQRELAEEVAQKGLSVRQTEELVRRAQEAPAAPSPKGGRPADRQARELEDRFRRVLGTKVSVSRAKRGGKLVIYYYDEEQLQSIYERLGGEP